MPHTSPGCSWGQRKGERGTRRQSSCRLPLSTPATPGLGPGVLEPRDPRPAPSHGPSSASPVAQYHQLELVSITQRPLSAVSATRLAYWLFHTQTSEPTSLGGKSLLRET